WLTSYSWPGNVRELQNCALYARGVAEGKIGLEELPPTLRHALADGAGGPASRDLTADRTRMDAHPERVAAGEADGRRPAERADALQLSPGTVVDPGRFERLRSHPALQEILMLLAQAELAGQGLGRRALAERVTSERLSPEQVRSRLKTLAALGLVTSSKGRRGTVLTPLGRAYVERRLGDDGRTEASATRGPCR
ncbi:MAG: hypothetical protein K6T67_10810, partial [Alicyclobacillus sp.]|nr:hypothetical protein [Alicyclobacillus sp.]